MRKKLFGQRIAERFVIDAKIVDATPKAKELGVQIGMTGREAVELMLAASKVD